MKKNNKKLIISFPIDFKFYSFLISIGMYSHTIQVS